MNAMAKDFNGEWKQVFVGVVESRIAELYEREDQAMAFAIDKDKKTITISWDEYEGLKKRIEKQDAIITLLRGRLSLAETAVAMSDKDMVAALDSSVKEYNSYLSPGDPQMNREQMLDTLREKGVRVPVS